MMESREFAEELMKEKIVCRNGGSNRIFTPGGDDAENHITPQDKNDILVKGAFASLHARRRSAFERVE